MSPIDRPCQEKSLQAQFWTGGRDWVEVTRHLACIHNNTHLFWLLSRATGSSKVLVEDELKLESLLDHLIKGFLFYKVGSLLSSQEIITTRDNLDQKLACAWRVGGLPRDSHSNACPTRTSFLRNSGPDIHTSFGVLGMAIDGYLYRCRAFVGKWFVCQWYGKTDISYLRPTGANN